MQFYTSIIRHRNQLLYRGYSNGIRVEKKIKFNPTLYVEDPSGTEYRGVLGEKLSPRTFESMSSAKAFIGEYDGIQGIKIHGNTNYVSQYIAENFPGRIKYDSAKIRVHYIDIEVHADTFPKPEEAKFPISAITVYDSVLKKYLVFGYGDFKVENIQNEDCKNLDIQYYHCQDEAHLLRQYISFTSQKQTSPDILTGWNIETFDIPYIINRIKRVFPNEDRHLLLSPWNLIDEKIVKNMYGEQQTYKISGIEILDYMHLFKKFGHKYGSQASYKLDNIAEVVLGKKKISFDGSIYDLYNNDQQMYFEYNIIDVNLVVEMEDIAALLKIAVSMSYLAGVQYSSAFGTVDIWDSFLYKRLFEEKTIVPPKKQNTKIEYPGGYVKATVPGMYKWVCSFDVNSLYPSIIMQWNMSPDTVSSVDLGNCTLSSCGVYFKKEKQGFLARYYEELYAERVVAKKEMQKWQAEKESDSKTHSSHEIQKNIGNFQVEEQAIKTFLNCGYGALASPYFRFYDIRIAESITTTGQHVIKTAAKYVNEYVQNISGEKRDYVLGIDTDSLYIHLDIVVTKFLQNRSDSRITDFLDKVCKKIETEAIDVAFNEIYNSMNCFKPKLVMKREAIASNSVFIAKKRYFMKVIDNEGIRYKIPKIKITGVDAVKSSTPKVCKEAYKNLFDIILEKNESDVQKFVKEFKEEFSKLQTKDIAFPRSVSNVASYQSNKANEIYKLGTPINSKCAILYNKLIMDKGLTKKYQPIQDGDRMFFVYLKQPNPLKETAIGFVEEFPEEFELSKYIDINKQFEKTFLEPTQAILDAIGWDAEKKANLNSFFEW